VKEWVDRWHYNGDIARKVKKNEIGFESFNPAPRAQTESVNFILRFRWTLVEGGYQLSAAL